jgi:PAS domain S-box-containing protein
MLTPISGIFTDAYLFIIIVTIVSMICKGARNANRILRKYRMLALALDQISYSILITNRNNEIIYVNSELIKSSGYTRKELLGANPSIFSSGKTCNSTYQSMWRTVNNGSSWMGEIINKDKSGIEYIESMRVIPIADSYGITHYLGVKEDISARKNYEAGILASKEAAETLALTKSRFLANMSHEIRTPMSSIIGFSDLALRPNNIMPTNVKDYLTKINISANELLAILNDILDITKIESGNIHIVNDRFNVNTLLNSVHVLFYDIAVNKGLLFNIIHDDYHIPANIIGDKLRLRQILVNLIGNALKFTDQGDVILTTTMQQLDSNSVDILFSITDTGIGIADSNISTLGTPFNQLNDTTSTKFSGTGLGLAITNQLLALMDSELCVTSTIGEGSAFSFTVKFKTT